VSLRAAPRIVGHAIVAAVFFFGLQRYVLGENLEISLIWTIAGGCGAAVLAWLQHRREG
jgi:hypothetical protein